MATQPGNRQPRSRSSTNRRVRSGTIRNARPTLTGTPARSHSGCSVPSQVSFATRCPGSRGRPFNQPPSASRCTYTRNESRRLTDSTDPSDRPHTSSSAPAPVTSGTPAANSASRASATAASTSAPTSAGAENRSSNRPCLVPIDSSAGAPARPTSSSAGSTPAPDSTASTPARPAAASAGSGSVPGPDTGSGSGSAPVGGSNAYRDSTRPSCGTLADTASSATDASTCEGACRATTATWSTDNDPASNTPITTGRSRTRRAISTTCRARPGDSPARSTNQCSGDRIPAPAHPSHSNASATRPTNRADSRFSRPHTTASSASSSSPPVPTMHPIVQVFDWGEESSTPEKRCAATYPRLITRHRQAPSDRPSRLAGVPAPHHGQAGCRNERPRRAGSRRTSSSAGGPGGRCRRRSRSARPRSWPTRAPTRPSG